MVVYAGSPTVVTFNVAGDNTTAGTLTVTAPDTTKPTPPALTTADLGKTWTAKVTFTTSGVWTVVGVFTGTGAVTLSQRFPVTPAAPAVYRTYATSKDLADYMDEAPPQEADRLLGRATVVLDRMLVSSVYTVNATGMPTDPVIVAALRDGVCELVKWWILTGDPDGVRELFTSAGVGSINLSHAVTRGPGTAKPGGSSRFPPHLFDILANAGLFTSAPWNF